MIDKTDWKKIQIFKFIRIKYNIKFSSLKIYFKKKFLIVN